MATDPLTDCQTALDAANQSIIRWRRTGRQLAAALQARGIPPETVVMADLAECIDELKRQVEGHARVEFTSGEVRNVAVVADEPGTMTVQDVDDQGNIVAPDAPPEKIQKASVRAWRQLRRTDQGLVAA